MDYTPNLSKKKYLKQVFQIAKQLGYAIEDSRNGKQIIFGKKKLHENHLKELFPKIIQSNVNIHSIIENVAPGRPCSHAPMIKIIEKLRKNEIVRELKRLIITDQDINDSINFLKLLENNNLEKLSKKAIERAFTASYFCPFSGNDGDGLIYDQTELLFTPQENALHNRVRDNRNKVVAHTSSIAFGVKFSINEQGMIFPCAYLNEYYYTDEDLIILKNCCSKITYYVHNKIEELCTFLNPGRY